MSCENCNNTDTCLDIVYTDCIVASTGLVNITGDNLTEILQNIDSIINNIEVNDIQVTVNIGCLNTQCTGEPTFVWKVGTSKLGGIKRVWSLVNYLSVVGSSIEIKAYSNGILLTSTTDPNQSLSFPVETFDNGINISITYHNANGFVYSAWVTLNNIIQIDKEYTVKLQCVNKSTVNQTITTSLENILNTIIQQICQIKQQL